MRRLVVFLAAVFLLACRQEQIDQTTRAIDRAKDVAGQATSMGEQTYPLEGRIVSRDPSSRQITVDHKEIPGFMAAMTMSYQVRGMDMSAVPPDGTEITATVHAKGDTYWLTDIKVK